MKYTHLVRVSAVALFLSSSLVASAVGPIMLIKDTYDNTANTQNLNLNLAGRQSGEMAPLPYVWTGFPSIVPSSIDPSFNNSGYLNVASGNQIWLDHSFSDTFIANGGQLTVSFDTQLAPVIVNDQWLHIGFGVSNGSNATVQAAQTDFGVLLRANGSSHSFTNTTALGEVAFDLTPTIDEIYHVDLTIDTTSFAAGAPATASLFVNGTQIDLDVATLGVNSRTFAWDGGANYIVFTASDNKYIDNLQINALIHEPSTAALFGLGGLVVAAWRRQTRQG